MSLFIAVLALWIVVFCIGACSVAFVRAQMHLVAGIMGAHSPRPATWRIRAWTWPLTLVGIPAILLIGGIAITVWLVLAR
jgi:hypothetical protein